MDLDLFADLQRLGAQNPDSVTVVHVPKSDRYWRAETQLSYLIQEGVPIGWKELSRDDSDFSDEVTRMFHLALFLRNEDQELMGDPGLYSVFRVGYDEIEGEWIAAFAELFGFYDGLHRQRDKNNPQLWSRAEAIQFMKKQFPDYEVIDE